MGAASTCGSPPPIVLEKRISVPDDVNFFLRSSPASEEIGLATSGGNKLLNVHTGQFRSVPGQIDPVLSPDGALLTIPETWVYNPATKQLLTQDKAEKLGLKGHVAFGTRYMLSGGVATEWLDVRKGKARATTLTEADLRKMGKAYAAQYMSFYRFIDGDWKLIGQDKDSQVVYQSVGVLGRSKDGTVYRLLVEGDGGLFTRDYELGAKGQELRLGESARAVCGGYHGTLPVIDKSGQEFSSFDPESGSTKIIGLGIRGDQCELHENLPLLLGKADFSPDRKRLVFHAFAGKGSRAPKIPGRKDKLAVYVYDRDLRALVPVPGRMGEESYYPVFLSDSSIAFLSSTHPRKRSHQQFFVNVANLRALPFSVCPQCYDGATRPGQLAALVGAISIRSCRPADRPSFSEAMGSFGLLDRASCEAIVNKCKGRCVSRALSALDRKANSKSGVWDGDRPGESWSTPLEASADELHEFCHNYLK